MSNEITPAIERGSSALNKHPLFGCTCCTWPDQYDDEHPDGCPREDGYTEHDYSDDCWKDQGRSAILTADVLSAALDVEEMAKVINEALMGYAPGTFDGVENGAWNARDDEIDVAKVAARLRTTLLGGAS